MRYPGQTSRVRPLGTGISGNEREAIESAIAATGADGDLARNRSAHFDEIDSWCASGFIEGRHPICAAAAATTWAKAGPGMSHARASFGGEVSDRACPIFARRGRAIKRALGVCPREHIVVIDLALVRVWRMVRNAIFVREIIDDGGIGAKRTLLQQIGFVVGEQSAEAIVPGAFANTILGIDLLTILVSDSAEKCAPRLISCAGHAFFGNGRANLVGTSKSRAWARFSKS